MHSNLNDPFYGYPRFRGIAPGTYTDETVTGPWLDTMLRGEIIDGTLDVSSVGAGGSVTLTYEMAAPDAAGVADAATVVDVPAGNVCLPKHADALPNQAPTIGANAAAVVAANAATAPLRTYIDPQYSSGSSGILRFVRMKAVVVAACNVGGMLGLRASRAGVLGV